MARPTLRLKSELSLAVARLRESMNLTQQQFAQRLRVTPVSLGRYETSRPPRGKILERLYRIAAKQQHSSASIFSRAMADQKQQDDLRRRMGAILDPLNVKEAHDRLIAAYAEHLKLMDNILNTPSIDGVDQFILIAAQAEGEQLLKMADLLMIGGRKELKELTGETDEND